MEDLKLTLENDTKYRITTEEDVDLYLIDTLRPKDWKFDFPTLSDSKCENIEMKSVTSTDFTEKFMLEYPEFTNVNFNNILIAGGCVGNRMIGFREEGDIDIFIYGLSPEDATTKLITTFTEITEGLNNIEKKRCEQYKSQYRPKSTQYRRTKGSVTLNNKYQIILRAYNSKSEVLHGFDIGSSAIGFDGKNVYVTSLGAFSYQYSCNIIDPTRRSYTYESRLMKYFKRGFRIVMPEFNIRKLDDRLSKKYHVVSYCELPYLPFSFSRIDENKIVVSRFLERIKKESDYDDDLDEHTCFYSNLSNLLHNRDNMIFFSDNLEEIANNPRIFKWNRINYFYKKLKDKINSNSFPRFSILKYMNIATPCVLINSSKEEVAKIIKEQEKIVQNLGKAFEEKNKKISWKVENPGSQLIGSFNPIMENLETWYGEYYKQ